MTASSSRTATPSCTSSSGQSKKVRLLYAQTGTFGGFDFDVEVFGDYMAEQNTIDTSIEASGIIKDDPSIMA